MSTWEILLLLWAVVATIGCAVMVVAFVRLVDVCGELLDKLNDMRIDYWYLRKSLSNHRDKVG